MIFYQLYYYRFPTVVTIITDFKFFIFFGTNNNKICFLMGITLQYELYYISTGTTFQQGPHSNGDHIPTGITFPHELHTFPKELHFDSNDVAI